MQRLTIILEDFDDSQIARSAPIRDDEIAILRSALSRANVAFEIEKCPGALYDYYLETERGEIDLGLRTSEEIKSLEAKTLFSSSVTRFLDSAEESLHLKDSFRTLTLERRRLTEGDGQLVAPRPKKS